jgi:hypothetical protein
MNATPLMTQLKTELIKAFDASGLKNAEFARRAGCSEPMALRLRDPNENCHLDTLGRGLAALGKRIEVKVVALLMALLSVPAAAQAPYIPQQCAVTVDVMIDTYMGPIDVVDACLTGFQHTGNHAYLTGLGDGIFKDGFDG